MDDLFQQTVRNQVRKRVNLDPASAVIGNGNGVIYDDIWVGSGKWYIRYLTDSGFSLPTLVRGAYTMPGLAPYDGQPCTIEYDSAGQLYIAKVQFANSVVSGHNPTPSPPPATGGGSYVTQDQLVTLRVSQSAPPSLLVQVSGWKPVIGTTCFDFPGGSADLTSFVPGTAGLHRAVGIFVKNDFATLETFASTSIPLSQALGMTDINSVLAAATAGSTAAWFYDLAYGALAVYDTNTLLDIRQIINTGNNLTVTDGSTTVYGVTTIDFTSGATVADVGGGTVNVAISGGGGTLPVAIYEEQQTAGTSAGTFTAGSFVVRAINTEVSDPSNIASLSGNNIVIAGAGTYSIMWWAGARLVDSHQTRLYNVGGAASLKSGQSAFANSTNGASNSQGGYILVVGGAYTFNLQHQCGTTHASDGRGLAANFGETEVYSSVTITKIG